MNILYIGSSGALSLIPFKRLLSTEHRVVAVGVHNPVLFENKVIALENESLALAADHNQISIIDFSRDIEKVLSDCNDVSIDIILMSCYGYRLPVEIIALGKVGCFNLHPSLLPQYRGPEPIFWQMKQNCEKGVSWHLVTNELDAGDIVKQKPVYLEDGESFSEIRMSLAINGADLMLELLADLAVDELTRTVQPEEAASYYPYPTQDDFVVDTAWTAQHAFNFMKATEAFRKSYLCEIGKYQYLLDKALDYDNNEQLTEAQIKSNILDIPCNEGVLTASFTGKL